MAWLLAWMGACGSSLKPEVGFLHVRWVMMGNVSSSPFHLAGENTGAISSLQSARYLEIACFTLMLYDLLTTFGEEVEYFWSGPWSLSRILFFLNRYLPFIVMIPTNVAMFGADILAQSCTAWIRAAFELSVIAICINQGILFLRVWYMYSHSTLARAVASLSYTGCVISTMILMGLSIPSLTSSESALKMERKISNLPGCSAPAPSMIWTIFVPSTVIHTILFGFTIARVAKVSHTERMKQLMRRLIRDGGLVFFASMASAIFCAVGARLISVPVINGPATWSNSQLAISSVAVSRLMLSIRSLAGKLRTSQNWIFNPSELSRVQWRHVSAEYGRSILVEIETHEPVYDEQY